MLCVVVLVAETANFSDFKSLRWTFTSTQTLEIAKIRRFELQERQHTTFQVKIRLF